MSYRRYILVFFISLFLIFIIKGIVTYKFYKVPKSTSLWIYKCYQKKSKYANSIKKNKLVFTAGSNVLYGINTSYIEKKMGIPTVNQAVNVNLKTDYILYQAKKILKRGDVIVIPMEYENITWDGETTKVRRDYFLTYDRGFFWKHVPLFEKYNMIYSIPIEDVYSAFKDRKKVFKEPKIGEGYNSTTLNKNGDETYKKGTKKELYTKKIKFFNAEKFKETKSLKLIKNFSIWCNQHDIKLIMAFPNIIDRKELHSKKHIQYFKNLMQYYKDNNIDFIGKPTDSIYPTNYFYDTLYHLNIEGSKVRTMQIIKLLKKSKYIQKHFNIR